MKKRLKGAYAFNRTIIAVAGSRFSEHIPAHLISQVKEHSCRSCGRKTYPARVFLPIVVKYGWRAKPYQHLTVDDVR